MDHTPLVLPLLSSSLICHTGTFHSPGQCSLVEQPWKLPKLQARKEGEGGGKAGKGVGPKGGGRQPWRLDSHLDS